MGAQREKTSGYQLPTYPFRVPPEIEHGTPGRYPVVIVGAGLAGLTAACDFAVRGIASVVLDEDDTIGVRGASSRGIVYVEKTLEIFVRLGIYDRVRARGVVWSRGKTLAGDDVVYEFDAATATPSLQPPFINMQQFYIEWFLVDRIMALGHADLRWKNRVTKVEDRGDHMRLDIETPAGSYRIDADWLIDASGLHSVVRGDLGVKKDDAARTPDRWCITDVRFEKPLPVERWTWVEAPFNDGRAVWQHLMPDDVWRMDFQMAPDSDPDAVSRPEVAAERIRRQIGDDVAFELVWVGPYAYRSYIIETFRKSRTFFIGDAAHVMSPFGARGGNSGIQDADNLVWKLALVMAGRAPESLLDSYDEERREGAEVNVAVTDRTTRFLAPRTPVEYAIRRAAIALAREYPFARALVNTGRLAVPSVYTRSSVVDPSRGGGVTAQNVPIVMPDGRAGDLVTLTREFGAVLIGIWFARAGTLVASTLDALRALENGRRAFRLVVCTPDSIADSITDSITNASILRMGDPQGKLAAVVNAQPGSIALLRPDLYLVGVVSDSDRSALEVLLGLSKIFCDAD